MPVVHDQSAERCVRGTPLRTRTRSRVAHFAGCSTRCTIDQPLVSQSPHTGHTTVYKQHGMQHGNSLGRAASLHFAVRAGLHAAQQVCAQCTAATAALTAACSCTLSLIRCMLHLRQCDRRLHMPLFNLLSWTALNPQRGCSAYSAAVRSTCDCCKWLGDEPLHRCSSATGIDRYLHAIERQQRPTVSEKLLCHGMRRRLQRREPVHLCKLHGTQIHRNASLQQSSTVATNCTDVATHSTYAQNIFKPQSVATNRQRCCSACTDTIRKCSGNPTTL